MAVMVVEDDESLRNTLELILRSAGFSYVECCGDAPAALERLQERRFDLVLSDWNMEPMDGIELLRLVRANPALADLPFVLMTANVSESYWLEGMRAGASEFIAKPFRRGVLVQTLAYALGVEDALADNVVTFPGTQDRPLRRAGSF
jgi:two-component system chemotaxis response regulator CheY